MRILIESPNCNAFAGSNAAVGYGWVTQIARHHEVHVVTYGPLYDAGHDAPPPPPPNVNVIRIPSSPLARFGKLFDFTVSARRRKRGLLKAIRPDIVHSLEPGGWIGARALATRRHPYIVGPLNGGAVMPEHALAEEILARLPVTPQQALYGSGARKLAVRMVNEAMFGNLRTARALAHRSFRRADRILLATDLERGAVPADCESKVRRLPLVGLDLDAFRPPTDRTTGPITVVYAGRIVSWKCLHLVIEAVAQVPDVHLRIVGATEEEWYAEHCRALIRDRGLMDRVVWRGPVPRETLVEEFGRADLFAMLSLWEPFGMTYVEAMACGTPVIGLATGGVPSIVEDGAGWLVDLTAPEGIAKELATYLRRLSREPAIIRGAGMRARALAQRRYSWDRALDQLLAIYEDVARPAPLRRPLHPAPALRRTARARRRGVA